MAEWNGQMADGDYSIQFRTKDKKEYQFMEKACQSVMDKTYKELAPVVHGKWESTQFSQEWSDSVKIYCECSNCEKLGSSKWKFCPNCGAKMDLK